MTRMALLCCMMLTADVACGGSSANLSWMTPRHKPNSRSFVSENRDVALYCLAGLTLDAYSTQKFLHERISNRPDLGNFREANPLAGPLVTKGWRGQVVASYVLGLGSTVALSYLMHRRGWHRLERLPFHVVGGASFGAATVNLNFNFNVPLPVYDSWKDPSNPHHLPIR